MATLRINVMSIVAIVLSVAAIIAVACYESVNGSGTRGNYENTYEAFLVIAIILALIVLIVTCMDVESVTGKTFLIYGLTAVLLLIGIILFGIVLHAIENNTLIKRKIPGEAIASIVFACVALLAAIAGTIAPFVCNK